MKVVQINTTCGIGSTGKICVSISKLLTKNRIENYILYSFGDSSYPLAIKYSDNKYIKIQALKSRVFGNYGFNSNVASKKLIVELDKISPDIVHLHNIHGHDFNIKILFDYFKRKKTKLFWTFHDCWAFTAYCTHFTMTNCDKWKTGCNFCPQKHHYSWFFDNSPTLFEMKKSLLTGLDLTIITPSQWLADLVKQSYLKDYPVKVINNGIDLDVFKPTESDFRLRFGIQDKFIILGVAFNWNKAKGLDVFIELAHRLDERFQIVLVGTDKNVDKSLPQNIISIHRTNNASELAEIYSVADVFVNPTREDNFPTTNLEALACGTPVITFNTGGSPESINETCGVTVDCDDISSMLIEIMKINDDKLFTKEMCVKRAQKFKNIIKFQNYIDFYNT